MEKIIYRCAHCNKTNPEYLNYKGLNCCKECINDLHYKVVSEKAFYSTLILTLKSAQNHIRLMKKNFIGIKPFEYYYPDIKIINLRTHQEKDMLHEKRD